MDVHHSLLPAGFQEAEGLRAPLLRRRLLPSGLPLPPAEVPAAGDALALPGRMLEAPWVLVPGNAERTARDLGGGDTPLPELARDVLPNLPGVTRLGDHSVTAAKDVRVDPQVVLDAREGPIHLAARMRVEPFTHPVGPAYIGPGSALMGGGIGPVSWGPVSKLRGEVRDAVLLGYANTAHGSLALGEHRGIVIPGEGPPASSTAPRPVHDSRNAASPVAAGPEHMHGNLPLHPSVRNGEQS